MIDTNNSYFVIFLAGIAVFMYGMHQASQSLEKMMASRVTKLLNTLSQSQFLAIVVGISLTTLLQSSAAVTSMLVGLGSARVITLPQVMGVIIGTAVGTTLTVQLISFNLSQYGLPIFVLAYFVYFVSRKPMIRNLASIFMGFGLLFFGLGMIENSTHHFAELEILKPMFKTMQENQGISLLVSMIFCALAHSSAVTIGLAMTLTQAGILNMHDAIFWVYGANIGTTSVALIASTNSNYIGKQVAWAHFFYKALSVAIFYPFTDFYISLITSYNSSITRAVANSHFFFNIISAMIFFPFIRPGARIIEKMFPRSADEEFSTQYLTLNNYQSSALAVSYADREIFRCADIVLGMLKDSIKLFHSPDPAMIESIKDRDNKVDYLYRETKMFLLDQANKSSEVHSNIMDMILFLSDLERAADAIDINIVGLAIKKQALKLEFSQEGWQEIEQMHQSLIKVASLAINSYHSREMCDDVINLKRELAKLEITFRENHISRLNRGIRESINTSSIHLDLLNEMKRIGSLLASHAYKNRPVESVAN